MTLLAPGLIASVLVGCTESSEESSPPDLCQLAVEAVEAGAVADDLFVASGPTALGARLAEVRVTLDRLAEVAPDELAREVESLWTGLEPAVRSLESVGFDVTAWSRERGPDEAEAVASLSGRELTELRVRVADELAQRCELEVPTPTEALGPGPSEVSSAEDRDPRLVELSELSADELTAVMARIVDPDELVELMARFRVATVSELASVLSEGRAQGAAALLEELSRRTRVASSGDDESLDGLVEACNQGDDRACDALYRLAAPGSGYELVAVTCGGRDPNGAARGTCAEDPGSSR